MYGQPALMYLPAGQVAALLMRSAAVAMCGEALCRDALQTELWCTYGPLTGTERQVGDTLQICCIICDSREHECHVCRRIRCN